MPRNSSGIYTAPSNTWNPAISGTVIDPTDWNATQADYVTALTDSLDRTGDGAMQANLNIGGFSLANVANVNLANVTTHGDSDYIILTTDYVVITSAALSTTRTWTLPLANAFTAGRQIIIKDAFGGITDTNTLIILRSGSNTIDGTTSITLNSAYSGAILESDGTSKWTVIVYTLMQGGTGQRTAAAARASAGLNIDAYKSPGDTDYQILTTDRVVGTTTLGAPRIWTLPIANTVNPGQRLLVADYNAQTTANALTITRGVGTDSVNGGASVTLNIDNGAFQLWSDGVSKWTAQAIGSAAVAGVSTWQGRAGAVVLAADDITAIGYAGSALGFGSPLINGTLIVTVAANAATIAIKTLAAADPSASDPVHVVFRNVAANDGSYTVIKLTAATSFVISSGSTMGAANSVPFRLWIVGFNDGGTFRLGCINCIVGAASPSQVVALNETNLGSSTAEGGAGGADTAGIFYTGTAVASKSFRILGYAEWNVGLTAAGTWDAGPGYIQIFGPGVKKPNDVVQTVYNSTATQSSTTVVAFGSSAITANITPTSSANPVSYVVTAVTGVDVSGNSSLSQVYRDAVVLGQSSQNIAIGASVIRSADAFVGLDAPGSSAALTYVLKFSSGVAGQTAYCGPGSIMLQELMG